MVFDPVARARGLATFVVRRLGESSRPAAVNFTTRDNSAVGGRDYVTMSGTLNFAPLEVTKSISVPLLNPGPRRQDREWSITLSQAIGVEAISGPETRLVLTAPFGFQNITGVSRTPTSTRYGQCVLG